MIQKTFLATERGPIARITFTLPECLWADKVYLVGDFNNWSRLSHPFRQDREGRWTITVDLEVGRTYQFRYLRQQEWLNESQADGYVRNPFGSQNFLVITTPPPGEAGGTFP